jgi:hypothetical protein
VPARKPGHAKVVFDDAAFNEDLHRAGSEVAIAARREYEQSGVPVADLLACDEEGRDSTRLPECLKVYLPRPAGRFGMVFTIQRQTGRLSLAYLAFGVRHHPQGSHALTVYQIADRRLHE